jgi:very-short-patch-repair endonuclease
VPCRASVPLVHHPGMDAADLFRAFLGILTTAQLLHSGVTRAALERSLAAGRVERVRRGWIAWHPEPSALDAVRRGGCVSCLDALEHLGAWRPRGPRGHVRLPEERRRARRRPGPACRPYGDNRPVTASIDDLETAFRCALRCADREQLVAVAESLVHRGLATIELLRAWAASAPLERQRWLDLVDRLAESGTESMVRLRLRALGLGCRLQVRIPPGRVDLLIGDRLIVECDSAKHHTDVEALQRDRRRDRAHVALGYLVVRLTWEQIHDDWPSIEADLLTIVRRGDHRWPRRSSRSSTPAGA